MPRGFRKPGRLSDKPSLRQRPRRSLSLSFCYLDSQGRFSLHDAPSGYLSALLTRLKAISALDELTLKQSRSSALRCHPVDFAETSEPEGFKHLNEQLRLYTPYQINVSSNEHGRIHGFFLDDVFYVVWLDHSHRLYP